MPISRRPQPRRVSRSGSSSWDLFRELLNAAPDDPRWKTLSRRCERLIRDMVLWRAWIRRRVGGTDSVEDVAQEVMLRLVVRGRRGFPRPPVGRRESFDGYMRRIAEHLIVDQFRRPGTHAGSARPLFTVDPRRFETGLGEDTEPGDGVFDPERPAMHRETMGRIRRTLDGMSRDPRQQHLNRHLFQLHFLDGISMAEISRRPSVPLSASSVSRRLHAIRSRLRQVFPAAHRPRRGRTRSRAIQRPRRAPDAPVARRPSVLDGSGPTGRRPSSRSGSRSPAKRGRDDGSAAPRNK